mmetsp:Transcript_4490/g.10967  ORF Transcript_4490/g.10967 Transcript_4490/m.10967 type:complete len:211 (+) Transcript_4490:404-1036(+)
MGTLCRRDTSSHRPRTESTRSSACAWRALAIRRASCSYRKFSPGCAVNGAGTRPGSLMQATYTTLSIAARKRRSIFRVISTMWRTTSTLRRLRHWTSTTFWRSPVPRSNTSGPQGPAKFSPGCTVNARKKKFSFRAISTMWRTTSTLRRLRHWTSTTFWRSPVPRSNTSGPQGPAPHASGTSSPHIKSPRRTRLQVQTHRIGSSSGMPDS